MSDPADSGGGADPGSRRYFADVLTFGWVLPAAIAAGAGLGWILDKLFGLFPVLTAALGVLGLVAGLRQIYRESEVLSRGDAPSGKGPGRRPGDGAG
jgi:F0F1-type ATP synthase assembly protein I